MSEVKNQSIANSTASRNISRSKSGRSNIESVVAKGIKKQVERILAGFQEGQLCLIWPDGAKHLYGQRSDHSNGNATVKLHSLQPLRRLITNGQLGFAESYLRGEWSTDSLVNLFSLIMRNEHNIGPATQGGRSSRLMNIWRHWSNRNSLKGSQRNIAFHYDLGNDFYKLWLDKSMSYSSALYQTNNDSLELAQQNKIDCVIGMLEPNPGSSVLEIGCGWGALSRSIASEKSCHVTGISLSAEQLQYATEHNLVLAEETIESSGSNQFEHIDYRDVAGRYDHIVSIEMFEAVGEQYWQTYFDKLAELLEPGGTAVIQTITLLESRFNAYRARPDFIQKYIFPGGMLPTKSLLKKHIADAGFVLEEDMWFGQSYAKTLAAWRRRFEQTSETIKSMNFDERFVRMWRYYLVYCETGFSTGHTDVGLVKLRKV